MSFGLPYNNVIANGRHNSIGGERYVYYRRLEWDGIWPGLGEKAKAVIDYRATTGGNPELISQYFFNLRDGEFQKEVELLEEKFGRKISSSYDNDSEKTGAELIKAINSTLNVKSVFERHLALIKETKGQKQIVTWFPTYFDKQWEANADTILSEIETKAFSIPFEQAVSLVFNKWIPTLVRNALIYMFEEADVENGIKSNREELKEAYQELADCLKDLNDARGNAFVDSFIEAYSLDEFGDIIKERYEKAESIGKEAANFKYKNAINVHSRGGLAAENLANFVAELGASAFDIDFKGTLTGSTGQKADAIFTIDIPTDVIEDWIEENDFGPREKNVQAMNILSNKLRHYDEGFIAYVNAKNYTLNKDFHGFSAGEPLTLEGWDNLMHEMHIRGRDFIFSIMQLIPGAVGDQYQEEISNMFARAIAMALFDDFDTVGMVPKAGAKSIHLFNLNGIFFPLSFYFHLLGQAFLDYSRSGVENMVKVDFRLPSEIKFETQVIQNDWQGKHPGESAWGAQQREAFDIIRISFHFMKAYAKLMRSLDFS